MKSVFSLFLAIGLVLSCSSDNPAGANGNRAPTAKITGAFSGPILEGTELTFHAVSSTDPDGDSLTYAWDVGDGLRGTDTTISRAYVDEGAYVVTLIVTDPLGASDTAAARFSVENVAPVLGGIVTPDSIVAGDSATFRVWATDPGISDVLTMQIDWKDGTTSTLNYGESPAEITVTHTYAIAGRYAMEVTVRDNDGGTTKKSVENPIVVTRSLRNRPPVARIDGPTSGQEGQWLHFTAAGSTDPDGDSLRVTCHSKDGHTSPLYPSYPCMLSFPDDGTYQVSAIAVDDSGAVDTTSMSVTIGNSAPIVYWFGTPMQEPAKVPASIAVLIEDAGKGDRHTIHVDWGDGTSEIVAAADTGSEYCYDCHADPWAPEAVGHTYATTGSYSITVTVQDDDGGVSSPITAPSVLVFDPSERQTISGYEAMDIGTLGGNAARPADLNNRGQVVGSSTTRHGAEHAFLWDQTGMHDLGALGHQGSEAIRINDDGVIAGTVWTHYTGVLDDNVASHNVATIWRNGVGTTPDSARAFMEAGFHQPAYYPRLFHQRPRIVRAINESGDVAFASYGEYDVYGWLLRNGSWYKVPIGAGGGSYPLALNDRGQAVGALSIYDGSSMLPYLWEGDSPRELRVLEPRTCPDPYQCSTGVAMDINENSQIAGISTDHLGRYHFVMWEGDQVTDLGLAEWTYPERAPQIVINDRGEMAGSVAGKAFFWTADTMLSLPSLGGLTEVVGINDRGEVVGNIRAGLQQHAFVWSRDRGMIDLGTGPHGFDAAWIVDINDRGDILGYVARCVRIDNFTTACGDSATPGAVRWTQVRAILWRNTQASASR